MITTRATEQERSESGHRRFSVSFSIEGGSRQRSGSQTFVDLLFDSSANAATHALAQARRVVDGEAAKGLA